MHFLLQGSSSMRVSQTLQLQHILKRTTEIIRKLFCWEVVFQIIQYIKIIKKKITWLPPIPWQLKIPTFSFSFLAMLSRHWFVSTFLIWEWRRAHYKRLMFLEESIAHLRPHQHLFSLLYTQRLCEWNIKHRNHTTMRDHYLWLKLPSKCSSYQVTESYLFLHFFLENFPSWGLFLLNDLSTTRTDTIEPPASAVTSFKTLS